MGTNWDDATKPRKTNGSDQAGPIVALTPDVLQLIRDICYEYLRDTGREISIPELADRVEHPGS